MENEGVSLIAAMAERDREAIAGMVADDVVFHGPATAYEGRDQVAEVLAIGGGVLQGLTTTREPATIGPGETVTFIEAGVEGEQLMGVLLERTDEGGRIAEVTILLRPMGPLQTVIRHIARGMAEGGEAGL